MKILASLASSILLFSAFAQDISRANWDHNVYSVGKIYPGYIIQAKGDTLHGFIKADNRCAIGGIGASNQNNVAFFTNETDKKPIAKYGPSDIKGYMVAGKVYESIAYSGGLFKKNNFNLVVEDGEIRLYEWYATKDNYSTVRRGMEETTENYDARRFTINLIVAKPNVDPIDFSMLGLSFVKKMPAYIGDNEALTQKVVNKEKGYTFFNLFEVIREYNEWAKSRE